MKALQTTLFALVAGVIAAAPAIAQDKKAEGKADSAKSSASAASAAKKK